ncbi:MAG: L,D-transpeptidase family protein [Chitinivibrionales bacterium]|nr:L,D-transpeptidase family protein [Chitinivibrionales bacterium]
MDRIRRFFQFYAKSLQFHFETWKRSREIARAYRSPRQFHLTPTLLRRALIVAVALAAAAVLIAGASAMLKVIKAVEKRVAHSWSARKIMPAPPPARVSAREEGRAAAPDSLIHSQSVKAETTGAGKNLLNLQEPLVFCIVANKATKTLYLLQQEAGGRWFLKYNFSIAIGKNEGPKETAGDKKTPEGTYFVIGRKDQDELASIYGPLAYVLNYPNDEDVKAGRTGQGIWIHGTAPDSQPVVSRGCLKLDNSNLLKLAASLRLGIGTPVIIVNQPAFLDPVALVHSGELQSKREKILAAYADKEKAFLSMLTAWEQAWESRDINAYGRFYNDADFSGEGMSWNAWRQRKLSIFQNTRLIAVTLQNIVVTDFTDSTAVVKFVQEYVSSGTSSLNGKKLYCVKSGDQWKITRENTFPKEELTL